MAVDAIRRVLRNRGFGSIQPDGARDDVFAHSSALDKPTGDCHSRLLELAATVFLWHAALGVFFLSLVQ